MAGDDECLNEKIGVINVSDIVSSDFCIGCAFCSVICPHDAIRMKYSPSLGLSIPRVNPTRCVRCGKCLQVCYGYSSDYRTIRPWDDMDDPTRYQSYIGQTTDKTLQSICTSGGIVTSLVIHALKQNFVDGAILTRINPGNPPHSETFVAYNRDDVLSSVGSKYCPTTIGEIFKDLDNELSYAIVGLPCHMYAISSLMRHNVQFNRLIKLRIGLLCGGMPSFLGTLNLLQRYGFDSQFIDKLEYRGGRWPGALIIESLSQEPIKTSSISYPGYWRGLFQYFTTHRCLICHDGFNEMCDISCGDSWVQSSKSHEGHSIIISRTKLGQEMIDETIRRGIISVKSIDKRELVKHQTGLVNLKANTLLARIYFSRFLKDFHPEFSLSGYPEPDLTSRLLALDSYIGHALASRKKLWRLLDMYQTSKTILGTFLRRLYRDNHKEINIK